MRVEIADTRINVAEQRQKSSAADYHEKVQSGVVPDNSLDNVVTEVASDIGAKKYSEKDVDDAVEKINQYADLQKVSLRLRIDEDLRQVVVSIVDMETEELIRQIPSEQAIEMAKRLDEMVGELFGGLEENVLSTLSDSV